MKSVLDVLASWSGGIKRGNVQIVDIREGVVKGTINLKEGILLESGMHRDSTEGKTNYLLIRSGPMYKRWAVHMSNGALLHGESNWLNANSEADYKRFRESAARHFEQWLDGEADEDHAAATFFNINGKEFVECLLSQ